MFKHLVTVGVAAVVALSVGKGLMGYAGATPTLRAASPPVAAEAVAEPASGAAEVTKAADGHYWAEAEVDGHWVRCLIDTGASTMALRPEDARRLGLDPAALTYDTQVNTAHGQTRAAQVVLDHVSVAGARVDHVSAMVVQDGLVAPLLGMSYLGRLSRFEATPTTLILRP